MTRASVVTLRRKQAAGRLNRRLGWVTLPLLLVSTGVFYVQAPDDHTLAIVLQAVFVPLFLVHVALSIYVFGFPRPRRTLRVFHIYLGYATFVVVMLSQLFFHEDPQHLVFLVLMYLTVAAHITIAVRYGVVRRRAAAAAPPSRVIRPAA